MNLARIWSVLAALLVLSLLSSITAAGAQAAANPRVLESSAPSKITDPDDVKAVLEDPYLPVRDGDYNRVTRDIRVTDRKTGADPEVNYGVFIVSQFESDETTRSDPADFPCLQVKYTNNPNLPRGLYRCTVIVDEPGVYTFFAYVNKSALVGQQGRQLATAQETYNIDRAIKLAGDSIGLKFVVEGRLSEVFFLQAHVGAASAWLLLSLLMAFLAVPRLRKTLSVLTLHTIEVRRGFLQSTLWAAFLVTLGTGIYLLTAQTAYDAPFTPAKWNSVTTLPYAQTYFVALYLKILIFLAMAAATYVLVMEANRRAQTAEDSDDLGFEDDDAFWERMKFRSVEADETDMDVATTVSEGSTAGTAVKAKPKTAVAHQGVTPRTLWVCVGVVLGGMVGVGVCVTLLKYLHELIEAVAALKTLNVGG